MLIYAGLTVVYSETFGWWGPALHHLSKKVQDALKMGKPVVALESTIITHGMPYPENLKTVLEVEKMVRIHGSTPATIAFINGYVKVGLEIDDMELLAKTGVNALKTSRRDMALAISQRLVKTKATKLNKSLCSGSVSRC
jgi:pseudouridine-5'-phosphate glycosidase